MRVASRGVQAEREAEARSHFGQAPGIRAAIILRAIGELEATLPGEAAVRLGSRSAQVGEVLRGLRALAQTLGRGRDGR